MSELQQAPHFRPRTRRRRRSKQFGKQVNPGLIDHLRQPWVGKAMFAAMLTLAALHLWSGYRAVEHAAGRSGPLTAGMTRAEVREAMGGAVGGDPAAPAWSYAEAGRTLDVAFAQDGTVSQIRCHEHDAASLACPKVLGIRVGDRTEQIVERLGDGAEFGRAPNGVLSFPEIGQSFQLVGNRVAAIVSSRPAADAGIWPLVLRRLVP